MLIFQKLLLHCYKYLMVFLLSLIALVFFFLINILGFFIAYVLVLKGDYENKYSSQD